MGFLNFLDNPYTSNALAQGLNAYTQGQTQGKMQNFDLMQALEQKKAENLQREAENRRKDEAMSWDKEKFNLEQKAHAGDQAAQGVYKVLQTFQDEKALQNMASNPNLWKPFATFANQAFEAAGYDSRLNPNMPSFTPPPMTTKETLTSGMEAGRLTRGLTPESGQAWEKWFKDNGLEIPRTVADVTPTARFTGGITVSKANQDIAIRRLTSYVLPMEKFYIERGMSDPNHPAYDKWMELQNEKSQLEMALGAPLTVPTTTGRPSAPQGGIPALPPMPGIPVLPVNPFPNFREPGVIALPGRGKSKAAIPAMTVNEVQAAKGKQVSPLARGIDNATYQTLKELGFNDNVPSAHALRVFGAMKRQDDIYYDKEAKSWRPVDETKNVGGFFGIGGHEVKTHNAQWHIDDTNAQYAGGSRTQQPKSAQRINYQAQVLATISKDKSLKAKVGQARRVGASWQEIYDAIKKDKMVK